MLLNCRSSFTVSIFKIGEKAQPENYLSIILGKSFFGNPLTVSLLGTEFLFLRKWFLMDHYRTGP